MSSSSVYKQQNPSITGDLARTGEAESHRLYLPDRGYIFKVVRRQLPFTLAVLLLVAPIALVIGLQQKDVFVSQISAIYDERDSSEAVARYPYYPRFGQVAEDFRARLADTEFLWQVAREAGMVELDHEAAPGEAGWRHWLREHVPGVWRLIGRAPKVAKTAAADTPGLGDVDDIALKNQVVEGLRTMLTADSDDKKSTLSLRVAGPDPVMAKQLADTAMELFIQSELRYEGETFSRLHELFANFLHDLVASDDAARRQSQEHKGGEKAAQIQGRGEEDSLREQESDLIEHIQSLRSDLDQTKSRTATARAAVEADLARLETKLQPSHPDVIAKREELREFARDADDRQQRLQLAELRQTLANVRDKERKLGMKVAQGEGRDETATQRGLFLPNLTDRVHELNLEAVRSSRQAESPALRTRLRVDIPANFDSAPAGRKPKMTIMVLLLVGFGAGAAAGVIREMRTPHARDLWRVAWRTQLPLLGEMPLAGLRAYQTISPQLALIMRDSARKTNGKVSAAEVLVGYRELELALRRRTGGNIIFCLNAGPADHSAGFWLNFLNVVTAETAGQVLLIDCNTRDPVPGRNDQPFSSGTFLDFLAGRTGWRDVRMAKDGERGFDLVAAGPIDGAGALLKAEVLSKLFANLGRSYQRIYIRGFEPRLLLENAALMAVATDLVLTIDARTSSFAEVDRSRKALDDTKLRGFVMLATS